MPPPPVSFAPPVVTSSFIFFLLSLYARHTPFDHMMHRSSSPPATATALDAPSGGVTSISHLVSTLLPLCSPPATLNMVTVRYSAFDLSAVTTTTPPPSFASAHVSTTLFAAAVFFFPSSVPSPGCADAASFLASAPNQRAAPFAPTTSTPPPPSPPPTATKAAIPSGSLVEPESTAASRDARGSASVQVTSAGSVSPGGRIAAKYRPHPGSYTAGTANV